MTIEDSLKRIAYALEAIATSGGEITSAPADKPEKKEPAKKKTRSKAKETVVGTPDTVEDGPTKEEVRAALTRLQKEATPAKAKSILKQHGASTIGNLAQAKYQQVIDEAEAFLDE